MSAQTAARWVLKSSLPVSIQPRRVASEALISVTMPELAKAVGTRSCTMRVVSDSTPETFHKVVETATANTKVSAANPSIRRFRMFIFSLIGIIISSYWGRELFGSFGPRGCLFSGCWSPRSVGRGR
jgi:hypothetical protein